MQDRTFKDFVYDIKHTLKCKEHRELLSTARSFRGYDYGYMYELIRAGLLEMLDYFKTADIAVMNYDGVCRDIQYAIKMLDILSGRKALDHLEAEYDKDGNIDLNNSKIVPDVYVNMNNIDRFANDYFHGDIVYMDGFNIMGNTRVDIYTDLLKRYPTELYAMKAENILWKILKERLRGWAD